MLAETDDALVYSREWISPGRSRRSIGTGVYGLVSVILGELVPVARNDKPFTHAERWDHAKERSEMRGYVFALVVIAVFIAFAKVAAWSGPGGGLLAFPFL